MIIYIKLNDILLIIYIKPNDEYEVKHNSRLVHVDWFVEDGTTWFSQV